MKNKTRELVIIAMYLAAFIVLDFVSNQMVLFKMPQGGTLGLGVIALVLASYHLGWKKGVIVCLLSVVLQFYTGKMYFVDWMQFIMEYALAFGIYGLCSIFPNIKLGLNKDSKDRYFFTGIVVTNLLRLLLHTIAGVLYWETALLASFVYNAWYMIPTMLVCLFVVPLVYSRLKTIR